MGTIKFSRLLTRDHSTVSNAVELTLIRTTNFIACWIFDEMNNRAIDERITFVRTLVQAIGRISRLIQYDNFDEAKKKTCWTLHAKLIIMGHLMTIIQWPIVQSGRVENVNDGQPHFRICCADDTTELGTIESYKHGPVAKCVICQSIKNCYKFFIRITVLQVSFKSPFLKTKSWKRSLATSYCGSSLQSYYCPQYDRLIVFLLKIIIEINRWA